MAFLTLFPSPLNPCPFNHISSSVHPVPTKTWSAIPIPSITMAAGSQTPQPSCHGATNPTAQELPHLFLTLCPLLHTEAAPGWVCAQECQDESSRQGITALWWLCCHSPEHTLPGIWQMSQYLPVTKHILKTPLEQLRQLCFIAITAGISGEISLCTPQTLS